MYAYHTLIQIAQVLSKHGVGHAVLSPGSRVAPLTIAFARHPSIRALTHSDERAAAYVGLGIAQQTQQPVALACTSGTAALNYAPAVTEAFYQQVPLIVCTADRPPEWVDQQDGQAIRQQNLYGNHVKGSFQLPTDYSHTDAQWHALRIMNEACLLAKSYPQGPVHINVPIREPFYPATNEPISFQKEAIYWEEEGGSKQLPARTWEKLASSLSEAQNILVVAGQGQHEHKALATLLPPNLPVVSDIISNLSGLPQSIHHHDVWLKQLENEEAKKLQPDLLITFGKSLISKSLKLYLRKYKPRQHWHIQESGAVADTFQSVTRIIRVSPEVFWKESHKYLPWVNVGMDYGNRWLQYDAPSAKYYAAGVPIQKQEAAAVQQALLRINPQWQLHLANSMAVRYANFCNLQTPQSEALVWANRGTSGIDGSSSTFVGHLLMSPQSKHLLITGDVAFFYDRNAFWHNYDYANARILLLNNGGGNIFRRINGPKEQPELEEYFVTRQTANAQSLVQDLGWEYRRIDSSEDLIQGIDWLMETSKGNKLLELFC